jgi:hypothetical protein
MGVLAEAQDALLNLLLGVFYNNYKAQLEQEASKFAKGAQRRHWTTRLHSHCPTAQKSTLK